MEAVLHGFDNEAAGSICEDPVELSTWEVLTELCVGEIHAVESLWRASFKVAHWLRIHGMNSNWATFSLSDTGSGIDCISYEIQTCHAETFFINGIIVEWIVCRPHEPFR